MLRTSSDDIAILNLARRWAPYGRVPTGEIWVTFGMDSAQFYANLTRILGTITARELSPDQRHSLEQLVARRHAEKGTYSPAMSNSTRREPVRGR